MQVTIEKDCHQISWGFSNINKVDVRFPEDQTNHESNDAYLTLEGIIQEARYDGAFPNVDLQCFILPTGVKENIIPKKCRHAECIGGQDSCPLAPDTQDRHVMCRFFCFQILLHLPKCTNHIFISFGKAMVAERKMLSMEGIVFP